MGCEDPDTLLHLLWDCPKLRRFSNEVLREFDSAFDTAIPRFYAYIILGLPNSLTYPLDFIRGRHGPCLGHGASSDTGSLGF